MGREGSCYLWLNIKKKINEEISCDFGFLDATNDIDDGELTFFWAYRWCKIWSALFASKQVAFSSFQVTYIIVWIVWKPEKLKTVRIITDFCLEKCSCNGGSELLVPARSMVNIIPSNGWTSSSTCATKRWLYRMNRPTERKLFEFYRRPHECISFMEGNETCITFTNIYDAIFSLYLTWRSAELLEITAKKYETFVLTKVYLSHLLFI